MSATFSGEIHPYIADLPIFEDEVASISESICEVGLLHPITLDTQGRLIGGRHRLAACERAGVSPEFEVRDGDPLAFMFHDNNSRKHQTTGQLVAERAMLLASAGRRNGGRWAYGEVISEISEITANERNLISRAGAILDHLGFDTLNEVASGDLALDAAYRQAEQARDAERHRLEREERIKAEEADAKAFIEQSAPELAEQVGGPFQSYAEAKAVWEKRNREEAERIAREKADKERHEREVRRSLTEMYSEGIGKALMTLGEYGKRDDPQSVMEQFSPALLSPPQMERYYTLDNLTSARKFIDALITWKESS